MEKHVILFLAANPSGTAQLQIAAEWGDIQRELRMADHRDDFEVESRWAVSVDDVVRAVSELKPSVLHFSVHGERGMGVVLQNEHGVAQPVAHPTLATIIEATASRLRVVVLNACYAAEQAEALRQSVDCVVGMAGAVSDDDARAYSVGFYRALGYRYSIHDAHELAVANVHGRRGTPAPELESNHRDVGGEPAAALDAIEPKLLARDGVNPNDVILAAAPVRRRATRLAAIAVLALVAMLALAGAVLQSLRTTTPANAAAVAPGGAPASDATLARDGDPPRDAPPDAPADARPDAAPDAAPPSIQILEPKPGSWVASGFSIKVRAEGDDISAVELLIDGRVVKPSAIAGTQLYSFTAPADLNVNRSVALRVSSRTGAGRPAAEASSCVWLRGRSCWVRRVALHTPLLGKPDCARGCVQLNHDGEAPQEKNIVKVVVTEDQFKSCATTCECREDQ